LKIAASDCASVLCRETKVLPVLSIALPVFGLILIGGIAGKSHSAATAHSIRQAGHASSIAIITR
jgi:hypothetical protein